MCSTDTHFLSTIEAAAAIGVGESSVKRWIDAGTLAAVKTPGGHRRITLLDLYRFLVATGRKLTDPAAIGLDAGDDLRDLAAFRPGCEAALRQGDPFALESALRLMRLTGADAAAIADTALYPAFQAVREGCRHPSEECLVLHRALNITRAALASSLAPSGAQLAGPRIVFADVGYEVDGLPTHLAEAAVWDRATCLQLGVDVPAAVALGALARFDAQILWLSASGPVGRGFDAAWRRLVDGAVARGATVLAFGDAAANGVRAGARGVTVPACGGALAEDARAGVTFIHTFSELRSFIGAWASQRADAGRN